MHCTTALLSGEATRAAGHCSTRSAKRLLQSPPASWKHDMFHDMFFHESGLGRAQSTQNEILTIKPKQTKPNQTKSSPARTHTICFTICLYDMFHDIRNARPPLNFKLSFSPSGRDAPHEGHPAKIEAQNTCHPKRETGRREGRESIDTWTPALDDDCIIAPYLRLRPPTCPS